MHPVRLCGGFRTIFFLLSVSAPLKERKKERENDRLLFFTQLVQAYMYVCRGLIDRYSGVDYEIKNLNFKFL